MADLHLFEPVPHWPWPPPPILPLLLQRGAARAADEVGAWVRAAEPPTAAARMPAEPFDLVLRDLDAAQLELMEHTACEVPAVDTAAYGIDLTRGIDLARGTEPMRRSDTTEEPDRR